MDQGGDKRREPTMADLEAFERLLRDSLQGDARPAEPKLSSDHPGLQVGMRGDDALAELSRLVEAPLELKLPEPKLAEPVIQESVIPEPAVMLEPAMPEPKIPGMPATEKAIQQMHAVVGPPPVETRLAAFPAPPPPLSLDEFEAELRRFELAPVAEPKGAFPDFRSTEPLPDPNFESYERYDVAPQPTVPAAPQPQAWQDWQPETAPVHAETPAPYDPQAEYEAEEAAYAQAAAVAAAAAAAAAARQRRSRVIFYSLGGLAALGATALAGSYLFSGKNAKPVAQRDVPVVVAKTDPTKEKPANPGGVEIPDQNKQILAPKTATETKPAQVVTSTEQPLDLNQVARRDAVRVIAPSPFQNGTQPAAEAPVATPPAGEPRRVQSVRLNDPVSPATTPSSGPSSLPPAGSITPSGSPGIGAGAIAGAGAIGAGAIAAIVAGNLARPGAAQPSAAAPSVASPAPATAPTPAPQPRVSAVVPPTASQTVTPPKVESRPVTAAQRPAVSPAATTSVPSVPRQPAATRATNAPLNLSNPQSQPQRQAAAPAASAPAAARPAAPAPRPAAAASTGGSGFAVQLASRPTEADARGAVGTLSSRYSGPLGGRTATVVSGQANGQTVYRVRVNGLSQADAASTCEKVKAAGGGCFVTRQ